MRYFSSTNSGIFLAFLRLGCLAFGGPLAHLGYFREALVEKRGWISDAAYADLVALCQFLPGPTSSQVGFALGYQRGGVAGAFAAWLGFTLPSAVLMIGFAMGLATLGNIGMSGWQQGLKLVAVAVVAQAIWGMAEKLCPDKPRALIALCAAALILLMPGALGQIAVIMLGGLLGYYLYRQADAGEPASIQVVARQVWNMPDALWQRRYLIAFGVLLLLLPVLGVLFAGSWLALVDGFYRAGSLVFGGGHVVLPLLESFIVGQGYLERGTFMAGYGAAQALPGPLFAFAVFLGASASVGPGGVWGGLLALGAIYLPSWLLVLGVMPHWEQLRRLTAAQAALSGTNAAVVGLMIAAFYDPVWTAAVTSSETLAFALLAFGLLRFARLPAWALVLIGGLAGGALF